MSKATCPYCKGYTTKYNELCPTCTKAIYQGFTFPQGSTTQKVKELITERKTERTKKMTTLAERMTQRMKEIATERNLKLARALKSGELRPALDKNGRPCVVRPGSDETRQ